MVHKKRSAPTAQIAGLRSNAAPEQIQPSSTFPLASYTSQLGIQVLLLSFSFLFLPRTSLLIAPLPPPSSSLDRPQHPFLEPITASPTATMFWICLGVSVVQGWWAGWMRVWEQGQKGGEKLENQINASNKAAALWKAWLITFTATALFSVVLTLFGAPLNSHHTPTILLAFLLALLIVYPPTYSLGFPSTSDETKALVHRLTWVRLFAELSPRTPIERALVYPVVGTVLGCWMGAIPIALDWDRPWQAWPLTPTFGAIVGYILGSGWSLLMNSAAALAQESRRAKAKVQ